VLAPHAAPPLNALVARYCGHQNGGVRVVRALRGAVEDVRVRPKQVFVRLPGQPLIGDAAEARFKFFTSDIMRKLCQTAAGDGHTVIFVPSSFDFMRLRQWFTAECKKLDHMSFVAFGESMQQSAIDRSRSLFTDSRARFALMSERFQFYFRLHLRDVQHLVFVGPPLNPSFYLRMVNMLPPTGGSVLTLFSSFDACQLGGVLGASATTALQIKPGQHFSLS